MASTDEDKRRTQEASDGKFSSRGSGGKDENEAATVVDSWAPALADGRLTLERALQRIRPLTDCCSARDLLILSCLSTKTAACATPAVWRRLRDREWAALPADDPVALKKMIQTLTNRGVWRASEAPLVARPMSEKVRLWAAELDRQRDVQGARGAIDAARTALGEDAVQWWKVRDYEPQAADPGVQFHRVYHFADYHDRDPDIKVLPNKINHWMGPASLTEWFWARWRLRATVAGRRLADQKLCFKEGSLYSTVDWWPDHAHFPACRGPVRTIPGTRQLLTGESRREHTFLEEPAWVTAAVERRAAAAAAQEAYWDLCALAEDAGEDSDSDAYFEDSALEDDSEDDRRLGRGPVLDTDDRIYDMQHLFRALFERPLRKVRLELDLVRVADGAVTRLASGLGDVSGAEFAEITWHELVMPDPFLRIYASLDFKYECPFSCGLHVRFYDSNHTWNGWDGFEPAPVPRPVSEQYLAAILARHWAIFDRAQQDRLATRVPLPATREVVAWRDSIYALHLLARRGALGRLATATVRVIGDFAYGSEPVRSPSRRTAMFRALEFACAGSRDAVACATPRPRTWPTPDHTVTDPSRYLFVAQVRGYWPSFAELYGVREDTTLFIPRTKHHLEFRLKPRGLERETTYDFSMDPLARYLTIHVVRKADGRVAELPMSFHNLLGGQWPLGDESDQLIDATQRMVRQDLYPLFHTLCRGRASFVNRGDQAVDCDLLRIDFRASKDEEYRFFPVRLGPGAREAHAAPRNNKWDVKGGGLLTFVDELFDLWYIAPPSRG